MSSRGTRSKMGNQASKPEGGDASNPIEGLPIKTSYLSNPLTIPDDFLTVDPPDAKPVTYTVLDFADTPLPEYAGAYAAVLDNVLSPSECAALLALAEASVPGAATPDAAWRPALVNIGGGFEVLHSSYRNSDRIIWDQQTVVDRLWERCARAPGVRERLSFVQEVPSERLRAKGWTTGKRWNFVRFNDRMRFLKYQGGQFFRPHCDGPYEESKDGKVHRTHYTVHLYLNDSVAEVGEENASLVGGATSFLSRNETGKLDVDPRAGRVLIFQHKSLYHSGADVVRGTKYTMRTDIIYEMQEDDKDAASA